MPLKVEKRSIDGIEFTVTQHQPLKAFPLFARLGKILGPAFLMALGGQEKPDARSLQEIFYALGDEDLPSLARDLFSSTLAVRDGQAISLSDDNTINRVFAGKLGAMFLAMRFAAEVNFTNFLGDGLSETSEPHPTGSLSS